MTPITVAAHEPPDVTIPAFGRHPISDRIIFGPRDAVRVWATERFSRPTKQALKQARCRHSLDLKHTGILRLGDACKHQSEHHRRDRSRSKQWKLWLWTILFGSCCILMFTQISYLVAKYRSYQVATTMRTIVPPVLEFPDVTICDTNPYDKNAVEKYFNETKDHPTTVDEVEKLTDESSGVESATFNERDLNVSVAFRPVLTHLGICSRFSGTKRQVYQPGYMGGLSFTYFLNPNSFLASTTQAGLVVYIHQPGTQVSDQATPVYIPVGEESYVAVQMQRYKRERDVPWSTCKGEAPAYTQNQCRAVCLFKLTRQYCNCMEVGDWLSPRDLPLCPTHRFYDDDDELEELEEFDDDSGLTSIWHYESCQSGAPSLGQALASCDCITPPCSETIFMSKVSSMRFSRRFVDRIGSFNATNGNATIDESYIVGKINFDAIRYEEHGEKKETTFIDLLAAIGGSMGLFLGISVISVIELIGEFGCIRVLPRCWGDYRLRGLGSVPRDSISPTGQQQENSSVDGAVLEAPGGEREVGRERPGTSKGSIVSTSEENSSRETTILTA